MLTSDFDFELPEELIAQFPLESRSASRLLHVSSSGQLQDRQFSEFSELLKPGDLLVFNDTRVIPARLFGRKRSGGKLEILVERVLSQDTVLAHVKASKSPKPGSELDLDDGTVIEVGERQGALFTLVSKSSDWMSVMSREGHMPLPPYIRREDSSFDEERYQTVYGSKPGAVAAPTAGLHFDESVLTALKEKGVETGFVTLHVGAGTFQPVRVDNIADHQMHEEYLEVDQELVCKIKNCKERGGRIIAVGTTSVRSLETAARGGELKPFSGMSDIFITPGVPFNVVDAMVTNFHLPQSTLLMLVSAFVGHQTIMDAYRHAVDEEYRFFSYGDAMFLEKAVNAV